MKQLGYSILLKKYFLIDLGVLLLLIVLPLFVNPEEVYSTIQRAVFYSGFITPVISYREFKKSHQLPFFDNLRISMISIFTGLLVMKTVFSLGSALYV